MTVGPSLVTSLEPLAHHRYYSTCYVCAQIHFNSTNNSIVSIKDALMCMLSG